MLQRTWSEFSEVESNQKPFRVFSSLIGSGMWLNWRQQNTLINFSLKHIFLSFDVFQSSNRNVDKFTHIAEVRIPTLLPTFLLYCLLTLLSKEKPFLYLWHSSPDFSTRRKSNSGDNDYEDDSFDEDEEDISDDQDEEEEDKVPDENGCDNAFERVGNPESKMTRSKSNPLLQRRTKHAPNSFKSKSKIRTHCDQIQMLNTFRFGSKFCQNLWLRSLWTFSKSGFAFHSFINEHFKSFFFNSKIHSGLIQRQYPDTNFYKKIFRIE